MALLASASASYAFRTSLLKPIPLAWKELGSFYKTQAEIFQNYKMDKIKITTIRAKAGDYYFKAIKFHSDSNQRAQLPDTYIQAGRILSDQASFANDSTSQQKFDKAVFYLKPF